MQTNTDSSLLISYIYASKILSIRVTNVEIIISCTIILILDGIYFLSNETIVFDIVTTNVKG